MTESAITTNRQQWTTRAIKQNNDADRTPSRSDGAATTTTTRGGINTYATLTATGTLGSNGRKMTVSRLWPYSTFYDS